MPGLLGIVEYGGGEPLARTFDRMCGAARHCAWYAIDEHAEADAAIGRVHLGRPATPPQPVWNPDRTRCLVFSGEVCNAPELRRGLEQAGRPVPDTGDGGVLLALHEQEGTGFVRHLDGAFALAVWDRPARRLILANDRYGLVPVYYTRQGARFLFGCEAHTVCVDGGAPRTVDDRTIADMLTFGQPLGDKTLFAAVSVLPPASIAVVEGSRVSISTYWDLAFPPETDRWTEEDALDELGRRFIRAVARRLNGRVLIPLSGGLDSRAIVAAVPRSMRLETYTFGDPDSADRVYARQIAGILHAGHHPYDLHPADVERHAGEVVTLTDGALDLFNAHGISVADDLRQHGECILTGLGGELMRNFYGYPGDGLDPAAYLFRHMMGVFPEAELGDLLEPSYHQSIRAFPRQSFETAFAPAACVNDPFERCDYFYLRQRVRRFTLSGVLLLGSRLGYRAPFLDNAFIDGMVHAAPAIKAGSRFHRMFIRRTARDLARIPVGRTGEPVLTTAGDRLFRRLRGLTSSGSSRPAITDYARWVRTDLAGFIRRILLDARTPGRGYFRRAYLERLVEGAGEADARTAARLSVLVTLELWHRRFVDGEDGVAV
jgi:asparagine synthase (glutamine-hydrolysing)